MRDLTWAPSPSPSWWRTSAVAVNLHALMHGHPAPEGDFEGDGDGDGRGWPPAHRCDRVERGGGGVGLRGGGDLGKTKKTEGVNWRFGLEKLLD